MANLAPALPLQFSRPQTKDKKCVEAQNVNRMEKFTQRNGNATGCPRQWKGKGDEGKPAHDFKAKYCRINLANKKLFDLRSAEGRIRLLFCWLFSRLFDFYRF